MTTSLPAAADRGIEAVAERAAASGGASPCPECGTPVERRYCPECGERRLEARDLRLGTLVREGLEDAVNLDGRLPRTLRELLLRPGELTRAWVEGRRGRYARPLTLFLTINVAFFLVIASRNILNWPLDSYVSGHGLALAPLDDGAVSRLVDHRAAASGLTPDRFAARFDGAMRNRQKTSLIVLVPLFALATAGVARQRRRPALQHLVFAIHSHAFLLAWFAGGALGIILLAQLAGQAVPALRGLGVALGSETGLASLLLGGTFLHLRAALGRAYGMHGAGALAAGAALTAVVAASVLVLRDLMFFITLYTV